MPGTSVEAKWNKILTSLVAVFGSLILGLMSFIGYQFDSRLSEIEGTMHGHFRDYDRSIVRLETVQDGHQKDIENLVSMIAEEFSR